MFFDARYYFKNSVNTFFVYSDTGGSAKIADNYSKGTLFNPDAGYKLKIAQKMGLIGSLGYNDQRITGEPMVTKNRYYGFAFPVGLLL